MAYNILTLKVNNQHVLFIWKENDERLSRLNLISLLIKHKIIKFIFPTSLSCVLLSLMVLHHLSTFLENANIAFP